MNINENKSFTKLSYDDQCELNSAGFSFSSILSNIGKFFMGPGMTNLIGAGSSISNIVNQKNLIDKINSLIKGEIEFGKNGEIKIKWDNSSGNNSQTIIF